MKNKLKIGDAVAFKRPESWTITPDDRQEKHETIGGVVVEDYGVVDAGETIATTAIFNYYNYLKVLEYWRSRQKVPVIDVAGIDHGALRVVVKSDTYIDRFESFHKLELEFWKV